MPTLQVAVDASKAKDGATQATTSIKSIGTAAEKVDSQLSEFAKTSQAYFQKLNAELAEVAKVTQAARAGQQPLVQSATEAKTVYEGMAAAIHQADMELQAWAVKAREAAAAQATLSRGAATLTQQTSALTRGYQQFLVGLNKGPSVFSGVSAAMSSLGGETRKVLNLLLGMSAGVAAVYAFKTAAAYITEFELTMARLHGVTQGTDQDMLRLADTARYFGATTIYNAVETGKALLTLAQAGFTVEQSIKALPGTLTLASAGAISLDEAASITTNTIRQFALATSQADKVADIFVNTGNKTNTNIQMLAEALEYTGPVAKAFGKSLEETAAAVGVLSNRGIQASIAGTNLRSIMAALADPTAKAEKIFKELGITIDQVDPSLNSLTEIMGRFSAAGLTAAQATEIFNRRNASAVLVLAAASQEIQNLTESNKQANGVAQKNADLINNSLYGSYKKLTSAIHDTFLATGKGGLVGAMQGFIDVTTGVIRELVGIEDAANKTSGTVKFLAEMVKFLALSAAGLTAIRLGSFLWSLLPPMAAGTSAAYAMGAAFRSLYTAIGPAGWVVIGLSAIVTLGGYFADSMHNNAVSADSFGKSIHSLSDALETLHDVMSRQKFATDTQDIRGQVDAMRSLATLQKETAIALDSKGQGKRINATQLREMITSPAGRADIDTALASQRANKAPGQAFFQSYATLPEATAYKLLQEEMKRTGEAADELAKKLSQKKADELVVRQTEVVNEYLNSLQEEQDLIGMSEIEKKGELEVRKALAKAKEQEIPLTAEQQRQIRAEAEMTAFLVEMEKLLIKAKQESEQADEKIDKDRKEGAKALDNLVISMTEETALLKLTGAEKDKLAITQKAENIAREKGLVDIQKWIDLLTKQAELQRQVKDKDETDKAAKDLEKYVRGLEDEVSMLGVDERARAALNAQLHVEELARGKNIDNLQKYIDAARKAAGATYDLKQAEEGRKKQLEARANTDKLMADIQNEQHLTGLANKERERAVELTKFQIEANKAYGEGTNEAAAAVGRYREELLKLEELRRLTKLADDIGQAFGDAFGEFIMGAKGAREAAADLLKAIEQAAIKTFVSQPIGDALGGWLKSLAGYLGPAASGGYGNLPVSGMVGTYAATGKVIMGGQVVPYAMGGIPEGILGSKMIFPMRGGKVGMAGEEGDEYLAEPVRMRNGRLGIRAVGGGETNNTTNVNMKVYTRDAASFNRSSRQTMGRIKRAAR